jgi:uncharacterized protein
MKPRKLEKKLRRWAEQYPVITVTGPRQSGKTTLCRSVFSEYSYCSLEDVDNRIYAKEDPRGFLSEYSDGAIIDEIQHVPDLVSYIQTLVDEKSDVYNGIQKQFRCQVNVLPWRNLVGEFE